MTVVPISLPLSEDG